MIILCNYESSIGEEEVVLIFKLLKQAETICVNFQTIEASRNYSLGIELLNNSKCKVWKTFIKPYLLREELCDFVDGNQNVTPDDDSELMKWKIKNARVEFALKKSISHNLFVRIMECKSTCEIWITFDSLFNEMYEMQLQMLENELENTNSW